MSELEELLANAAPGDQRIGAVVARLELSDWLEDHGADLARLALDMGEALRHLGECRWDIHRPALERLEDAYEPVVALVARLDGLAAGRGKGD